MPNLRKVLICNRGEIAIRIARAAATLGIESVAVYPPEDSQALHTRIADSAQPIPAGGPSRDPVGAYLNGEAMIQLAQSNGCDCLHPGYGFLAENAEFSQRCAAAGITFVGPNSAALQLFGDKLQARALAQSLDIPVVPGSKEPIVSVDMAQSLAQELGFPVMLKAAAGGGGRGMRVVERAEDLAEALERCRSEAYSAFGSDAVFVERLVCNPRHIEVQILADLEGHTIHLYERDCSVQLRHQKVIEIAPASHLQPEVRQRLHCDAVRLVTAANYSNAGTVEFLVSGDEYFFIECNPRIQVEHTVTEQVLGIDLVEAQFQIAAGASLTELGLPDQQSVGMPRGYAVQARVVAESAGTLSAYREPSGVGIRVDGHGYSGYMPAAQFDPLLAKVIGSVGAGGTLAAAIGRTERALGEFYVEGLRTNLGWLQAILRSPDLIQGQVSTAFLDEHQALLTQPVPNGEALALLASQGPAAKTVHRSAAAIDDESSARPLPKLASEPGDEAVQAPMGGAVIEVAVSVGDQVAFGDPLLVISAMKMESVISAPCNGRVRALQQFTQGDSVQAAEVVAVIAPAAEDIVQSGARRGGEQSWQPTLDEVETLRRLANERLSSQSQDPGVVRQRNRGKLTCRERIDLLLDPGSFREVGSVAGFASYDDEGNIDAFTPANSVGGWGRIGDRPVNVCADDFTSRGGHADGAIGAKSTYLDRLSIELRRPSIRLLDGSSGGGSVAAMVPEQKQAGESSAKESRGAIKAGRPRVSGGGGSFLPGHLGSTMYTEQLGTVPVVNLLLGSVVGIGAAKAVLGHFSVMVRDVAQLFVAGPPVVAHAMGYEVSKEELGGWHIHCCNGSVDNLAETEQEAVAMARRFLSFLPGSAYEAAPVLTPNPEDPADRVEEALFALIPRKRTTTFDMRLAIRLMADKDSFFEIGPLWGTDQITGFVRFNGYPMGVIGSDSQHANGGALTADGCDKLKRHLDLCDLFHIPVLNLIDNPGFAVGVEHEIAGTIRKGGEWMVAFAQVTVPIFTVVMRRSFGVAGNNYATPRSQPSARVVWPAADTGGIPPEGGIEAAYKRQLAEAKDPAALRAELNARIESARGPLGPLSKFQMEEMIDPRDTRRYVCEWLESVWQIVSSPSELHPRVLQFRP
ncbi:MAG: carboxyl transferase domain-containing protein [Pseudomonadales bacterium]